MCMYMLSAEHHMQFFDHGGKTKTDGHALSANCNDNDAKATNPLPERTRSAHRLAPARVKGPGRPVYDATAPRTSATCAARPLRCFARAFTLSHPRMGAHTFAAHF
jgi:hypothetical protein